ncbi:hypothetical protein [Chromobacterium rhizoryzae]|uniref:hypothetical protein n=1 Tax=Chromobacterium rhizoryzae TaxID=1778675 RepID=UPI001D07AAD3|nr:hypothetical protein [Chromobacterium rhizoryzae]
MNNTNVDDRIQSQMDVVQKILEATYNDQQATEKAISDLNLLRQQVDQRINFLKWDITEAIESSAEKTASKAADLLASKFADADKAAQSAKKRYESSARHLGWKLFAMWALVQLILLGCAYWMFQRTIPSKVEIESRRQIVESLRQDLAQIEKETDAMKRRQAKLIKFEKCQQNDGTIVACIQIDNTEAWTGKNGESYRRPIR